MSIAVMSWVWKSSKAKGLDKLVLLAIADWAWDDGSNAWPSVATMAKKTGVNERTVQRAVRALAALGELQVETNAGKKGANMYRVVMPTPVNESPRTEVTPSDSHPGTESGRGGTQSRNPRTRVTRTSSEPVITTRERERIARADAARKRKAECTTCAGDGWITDDNGKPLKQCRHQAKAS